MAFQTRSISLPSNSHSYVLKAEAELQKLRASLSLSSHTSQIILEALQKVCSLYECIDDILCTSSNGNVLSHPKQRRVINQELNESIILLDMCSMSRDNLCEIKTQVQDLESSNRRCGSEDIKTKTRNFINLVKKSSKHIKKRDPEKGECTDGDASAVLGLLRESREITISLLQFLFSVLSKQIVGQKTSKWSIVSRKVTCKEDALDVGYFRINVERLENGVECMFRRIIQCRVTLLNACSL